MITPSQRIESAVFYLRHALDELREAEKHAPGEVEHVVVQLIAHVRAWRVTALLPPEPES